MVFRGHLSSRLIKAYLDPFRVIKARLDSYQVTEAHSGSFRLI